MVRRAQIYKRGPSNLAKQSNIITANLSQGWERYEVLLITVVPAATPAAQAAPSDGGTGALSEDGSALCVPARRGVWTVPPGSEQSWRSSSMPPPVLPSPVLSPPRIEIRSCALASNPARIRDESGTARVAPLRAVPCCRWRAAAGRLSARSLHTPHRSR